MWAPVTDRVQPHHVTQVCSLVVLLFLLLHAGFQAVVVARTQGDFSVSQVLATAYFCWQADHNFFGLLHFYGKTEVF